MTVQLGHGMCYWGTMLFRNWYYLYANQTAAELALEPAIAALGRRYRAQHLFPKLRHVADFALLDDRLIIEVDGRSHLKPDQIRKDLKHTLALLDLGWRVVRCSNEEAEQDPQGTVLRLLVDDLNHRTTREELLAKLQALGPEPVRARPRRRTRKPGPRPSSGRRSGARRATASPVAPSRPPVP